MLYRELMNYRPRCGGVFLTDNNSFTLQWSTSNATSCTASGDWSGSQAMSGFASGSRSYTLTCSNSSGSNYATVVVYAFSTPALNVTANFGNEIFIEVGNSYTLRWSAAVVTSCTASGAWSGNKGANGSL